MEKVLENDELKESIRSDPVICVCSSKYFKTLLLKIMQGIQGKKEPPNLEYILHQDKKVAIMIFDLAFFII